MLVLRAFAFIFGAALVVATLASAIGTTVLPRAVNDNLTRSVFLFSRRIFNLRAGRARTYEEADRALAYYAPVTLMLLPATWLLVVWLGYGAMFWALSGSKWPSALLESGSSLLTLGFAPLNTVRETLLAFTEAAIGLTLVALLIAYLPTMYAAFARREAQVNMLAVRAGEPPFAEEMLLRYHRIHGLDALHNVWTNWEMWFADINESHTSLAALAFFRSPKPSHSWVTAAGAVLDAASITNAALDITHNPQADLCIRAGYLALRDIAAVFHVQFDAQPRSDDPISISRGEFDEVYEHLAKAGLPMKPDRDQAWRDFAGWRVNYDTVLLALARLLLAPYAPWSSDRSLLPR